MRLASWIKQIHKIRDKIENTKTKKNHGGGCVNNRHPCNTPSFFYQDPCNT